MIMKILWLSSVQLTDKKVLGSGTWIPGMYAILKNRFADLEIVNLTWGGVSQPIMVEADGIKEWIIPKSQEMTSKTIRYIDQIIIDESPDVIQVWGTEDCWGMFPFTELCPNIPAIVEIQGILASVSEEYYGGLTPWELVKCWNIKEFLKPSSSLPAIRHLYTRNIEREKRILELAKNIGVQSKWSARVVRTYNRNAQLYNSGIALRPAFYSSMKWDLSSLKDIKIFSTALMGQPLKGAWTLFKAFAIVKKWYPNAQLILAGVKEEGLRRSGFCRMLIKFAEKHGFIDDIQHMGKVTAEQLAELYRTSSIFVNPSNWESYSVVTAESMYIGTPTVAAYSGAMPELGKDNSVMYFPKGDHRICASMILDILGDESLAKDLSERSIRVAEIRQNRVWIADQQMDTYNKMITKI